MVPHYYIFYDMRDIGYYTILCRSFSASFDSVIFWRYISNNMEHFFIGRDYEIFMSTLYILFIILLPDVMSFSKYLFTIYILDYICCLCSSINFFMANFIFILCEVITKVNKTSNIFTGFYGTFLIVHAH